MEITGGRAVVAAHILHAHLLLLHDLQEHLVLPLHIVKLIQAADAAVREHERAGLKRELVRDDVLRYRHRQAGAGARLAAHVHAPRRRGRAGVQQLALAEARLTDHERVDVVAWRQTCA